MTRDLEKILEIKRAYDAGELGSEKMPEDSHPIFKTHEERLRYFTLPMALNYQRNSYKLWEAALATYEDITTVDVFDFEKVLSETDEQLREKLLRHKVALQPTNHIKIWKTLVTTFSEWTTLENFFTSHNNDFFKIRETIQKTHKKEFPYLSGPKIFNYWSHIMERYGGITLLNREFIDIAPDTHVIQASIKLGVLTENESVTLTREQISTRWREILKNTQIAPIDMHSALWFWNRKEKSKNV